MWLSGWALIQYDEYLYKESKMPCDSDKQGERLVTTEAEIGVM